MRNNVALRVGDGRRAESTAGSLRRLAIGVVAGAAVLAGCAGGGDGASASPAASVASATPGPGEFQNPVIEGDFPDPGTLLVDGTYYAYATTNGAENIQGARSTDLVSWERIAEPLPVLPDWASGDTWAPEVINTSAGFVMFYSARVFDTPRSSGDNALCVTHAVANGPEGPFRDDSSEPLVCPVEQGGAIDAFPFRDEDGTLYLIWKNDGNCCGIDTEFWAQPLSGDGLTLTGEPTSLGVRDDEPWEGRVIEAPSLFFQGGTYYLFFSANSYAGAEYAVGYATSDTMLGPYTDAEENPILRTPEDPDPRNALGPGGQSVVADPDGDLWMVYHSWNFDPVTIELQGRSVWMDELTLEDGTATVAGPDSGPQPVP
ncbi:MAG: glycoside hydrolase family 43 protein [Chloroflexota bacterium]|nr:glycoside hydrolase family 43 protein [Chloroflexota bacterium]